jgi:hypothetical protein
MSSSSAEVKDAINSIVNNRNQIAHGGQTGISLLAFTEYYLAISSPKAQAVLHRIDVSVAGSRDLEP